MHTPFMLLDKKISLMSRFPIHPRPRKIKHNKSSMMQATRLPRRSVVLLLINCCIWYWFGSEYMGFLSYLIWLHSFFFCLYLAACDIVYRKWEWFKGFFLVGAYHFMNIPSVQCSSAMSVVQIAPRLGVAITLSKGFLSTSRDWYHKRMNTCQSKPVPSI